MAVDLGELRDPRRFLHPNRVTFVNDLGVSLDGAGNVILELRYAAPDGVRCEHVVMPAGLFASKLVGPGHDVVAAASEDLTAYAQKLAEAVAKRAAKRGGGPVPAQTAEDAARRRREAGG